MRRPDCEEKRCKPGSSRADAYNLRRLRDEYPLFWKEHGAFLLGAKRGLGYFLWKPFLISAKLDEIAEDDFLVYANAGCEFNAGNERKCRADLYESLRK